MDETSVLTVPARFDQIRAITKFVTGGAAAAGLDDDAQFHLELCCDEASTNIIEHAYGAEDLGPISVAYHVADGAFYVKLCDHGRPFNPKEVPEPTVPSIPQEPLEMPGQTGLGEYLDSLQVGGLGIHFMRKLMDEVHYSFDKEQGNRLTLVKYLPDRVSRDPE